MLAHLRALWLRVPFHHMIPVVIMLFLIKEQFPFSNFPMYSNFDSEADVVFITDQNDKVQPMDKVFRSGSSTAKKAYKKELGKITSKRKRDTKEATAPERAAAGKIVLADWVAIAKPGALAPEIKALRLYRRTFELVDGRLSDKAPELLAEQTR
ncbi:MAG: hypothetical protein JWO08_488 [Verrucomicrobiaceae bacterium]|nr:hypothetical protein [Verrucomicrobiaceae bacterium]